MTSVAVCEVNAFCQIFDFLRTQTRREPAVSMVAERTPINFQGGHWDTMTAQCAWTDNFRWINPNKDDENGPSRVTALRE